MPIITFTSDFGLDDVYVGVVHGVVAGIAPAARVVDLTHGIPPQDVRAGALALYTGCRHFPAGTIHLAVVDPGVGTARRPLLLKTAESWFIGPDNGLFSLVAPPETLIGCWDLTWSRYARAERSATFHGRDLFAPVAAHLARGAPAEALGVSTTPPLALPDLRLLDVQPGETVGTVLTVDHFGNMITNIRATATWHAAVAAGTAHAWLEQQSLRPARTYGDRATRRAPEATLPLLLLAGSSGLLEVASANGHAARISGLGIDAQVRVMLH